MPAVVGAAEFAARTDLPDWRYLLSRLEARFEAGSFRAAAALVEAIADAADAADHHPDVDLRYPGRLRVVLSTHAAGGAVTDLDLMLAATISRLAADAGASSHPSIASAVEVGIDAMEIGAVRPFWKAVLGYVDDPAADGDGEGAIVDPARLGPPFWFQQLTEPRRQRNRLHIDVTVPHDVAEERVAAALAAGGTLVTAEFARSWWVLADVEGNEACVCTWQDRGP
jgi:4a-hydroxytetrahydrobiopterin dehydratase